MSGKVRKQAFLNAFCIRISVYWELGCRLGLDALAHPSVTILLPCVTCFALWPYDSRPNDKVDSNMTSANHISSFGYFRTKRKNLYVEIFLQKFFLLNFLFFSKSLTKFCFAKIFFCLNIFIKNFFIQIFSAEFSLLN